MAPIVTGVLIILLLVPAHVLYQYVENTYICVDMNLICFSKVFMDDTIISRIIGHIFCRICGKVVIMIYTSSPNTNVALTTRLTRGLSPRTPNPRTITT